MIRVWKITVILFKRWYRKRRTRTVGIRQLFCDHEEECDDGNAALISSQPIVYILCWSLLYKIWE